MSETVGYQIGYRTEGKGGYTSPYFDFPMFKTEIYGAYGAKVVAERTYRKVLKDFPEAEWRIVEVRE